QKRYAAVYAGRHEAEMPHVDEIRRQPREIKPQRIAIGKVLDVDRPHIRTSEHRCPRNTNPTRSWIRGFRLRVPFYPRSPAMTQLAANYSKLRVIDLVVLFGPVVVGKQPQNTPNPSNHGEEDESRSPTPPFCNPNSQGRRQRGAQTGKCMGEALREAPLCCRHPECHSPSRGRKRARLANSEKESCNPETGRGPGCDYQRR